MLKSLRSYDLVAAGADLRCIAHFRRSTAVRRDCSWSLCAGECRKRALRLSERQEQGASLDGSPVRGGLWRTLAVAAIQ